MIIAFLARAEDRCPRGSLFWLSDCRGRNNLFLRGVDAVNLTIWIPAMILLGLLTMGLMFAFVKACDKV